MFPAQPCTTNLEPGCRLGRALLLFLLLFFVNSLHMSSGSWFDCVIFSKQALFCLRATVPRNACAPTIAGLPGAQGRSSFTTRLFAGPAVLPHWPLHSRGAHFMGANPERAYGVPASQILRPCPSQGQTLGSPLNVLHIQIGPTFRSISVTFFQSSTSLWGPTMCSARSWVPQSRRKIEARPGCLPLDRSHSLGGQCC